MAAFTYPGVYIEEISSGQHTITGVATSIAAFIGWTNQGPINEAVMVESWAQYQATFGGMIPGNYLGYAVYQFFLNGGSQAYIIRLVNTASGSGLTPAATASGTFGAMQLYANNPGAWGNNVCVSITNVVTAGSVTTFNLQVSLLTPSGTPATVESYTNLSTSPTSPQYALTVINNDSNYISFNPQPPGTPATSVGAPMVAPPPAWTVPGAYAAGGPFTVGEAISQTAGASAIFLGGNATTLVLVGLSGNPNSAAWTAGAVTFNPSGAPASAPVGPVPGAYTAGGPFTAGETITQTGGATAVVMGTSTATTLVLVWLSGNQNSSAAWTVGAVTFTPTGLPTPPTLWNIAGAVTTVTPFTPGETVTQSGTGATATLFGVVNGSYLVLSTAPTGTPNSSGAWTDTGGASFAPTTTPVKTASVPLCLAAPGAPGNGQGNDGSILTPNQSGFETQLSNLAGVTGLTTGYQLLSNVPIFNLLCVPGENSAALVADMQQFCWTSRAFLIVDSAQTATVSNLSGGPSDGTNLLSGGQYASNSAFYFPWISAPDPQVGFRPTPFPPCGFVAGLYASTDASRGVWKAPAGINIPLTGTLGLQTVLTDLQNGQLNPVAVNCLRQFPIYGEAVWGTRTMAGADAVGSQWKYVPIRRLALFLESSLYQGTQWVVFEPNAEPLWGQVRLSIGTFMQGLFLQGAFAGTTPQQAYFVKCDSDNNPGSSIAMGILNITVGFAPLYPAEFVVIQIQQMMNQS